MLAFAARKVVGSLRAAKTCGPGLNARADKRGVMHDREA